MKALSANSVYAMVVEMMRVDAFANTNMSRLHVHHAEVRECPTADLSPHFTVTADQAASCRGHGR